MSNGDRNGPFLLACPLSWDTFINGLNILVIFVNLLKILRIRRPLDEQECTM